MILAQLAARENGVYGREEARPRYLSRLTRPGVRALDDSLAYGTITNRPSRAGR